MVVEERVVNLHVLICQVLVTESDRLGLIRMLVVLEVVTVRALIECMGPLILGFFFGNQRKAVGHRNLVVIRMDFIER